MINEGEYSIWNDADYTYDDLIQTDEYKEVINLGLIDTTSEAQKKHLTLRFVDPFKPNEYYQSYIAGRIRKIAPAGGYYGSGGQQYMWVLKRWEKPQYLGGKAITFDTYKEMIKAIGSHHKKVVANADKRLKKSEKEHGHDFIEFIFERPNVLYRAFANQDSDATAYQIADTIGRFIK